MKNIATLNSHIALERYCLNHSNESMCFRFRWGLAFKVNASLLVLT